MQLLIPLKNTAFDLVCEVESNQRKLAFAYLNWLFNERRVLAFQMFGAVPGSDNFIPCGTGIDNFHLQFLADGVAGVASVGPMARAGRVLLVAGVPLEDIVARSAW